MVTQFKGGIAAALAGVGASFVFAAPASGQSGQVYIQAPPNLRVERIGYWDLNLATRAGEQALQLRVGNAIERVCLNDEGRWYGFSQPDYNYCVWGAWRRARPQITGAVYRTRQAEFYRTGYYYRRY